MARLETPALVDRNVHQHRAGLHRLQLLAADELRRRSARDQHCADHEVGLLDRFGQRMRGRVHRLQAAAELLVELAEAHIVPVKDGYVGAHAHRNFRRMGA